ncbi:MAG TPA: PilZ domain-containing protein [Steroidobacteraceae bacterium]|nr:PilZ domain-containing protein [Steroidobacteraceae bacterium]
MQDPPEPPRSHPSRLAPLDKALVRVDSLPLRVTLCDPWTPEALYRCNSENLDLLHAIAAFDQAPREPHDEHASLAGELARLDAKLRLVLRLLARQLAPNLPPPCDVRLGAEQLSWLGPPVGTPGAHAVAELYVSPVVVEPLRLPGILLAGAPPEERQTWQALRFQGLSAALVDALEQHVFLHHRRAIAQARS